LKQRHLTFQLQGARARPRQAAVSESGMISGFSATFANFYLKRSIASIAAAICEGAKSCAERSNVSLILIFHIGTLAYM
jgi:hypothetical protein